MEAGRCIANGFCTPDRTLLISSTSRFYVINEKMALGDGRFDDARLLDAAEKNSQSRILFDMESVAKESGAMINAVMLGAIAGCGKLPIPAEAFEQAIREDGKAAEANLRGFRAGLTAAKTEATALRRADRSQAARKAAQRSRFARSGNPRPDAEAGAGRADRRRAAADALPGRGLRAALPRSSRGRSANSTRNSAAPAICCARPRGISRCACRSRT